MIVSDISGQHQSPINGQVHLQNKVMYINRHDNRSIAAAAEIKKRTLAQDVKVCR